MNRPRVERKAGKLLPPWSCFNVSFAFLMPWSGQWVRILPKARLQAQHSSEVLSWFELTASRSFEGFKPLF